jgi:hypothetical protein
MLYHSTPCSRSRRSWERRDTQRPKRRRALPRGGARAREVTGPRRGYNQYITEPGSRAKYSGPPRRRPTKRGASASITRYPRGRLCEATGSSSSVYPDDRLALLQRGRGPNRQARVFNPLDGIVRSRIRASSFRAAGGGCTAFFKTPRVYRMRDRQSGWKRSSAWTPPSGGHCVDVARPRGYESSARVRGPQRLGGRVLPDEG